MASKLKPNATTAQINEFLDQLRIPNFRIHPRLVEFNNSNDRQRKITLLCNKLIVEGLPKAAAQAQSEELADADTISVGIKSLKQTGSVLMLAGLEEKDLQQQLPAEASTHVMLVFLKEKKVSILFYNHLQY
jgi:pyruvate carboxylase